MRLVALLLAGIVVIFLVVHYTEKAVRGTKTTLEEVLSRLTGSKTKVVAGRAEVISQNDITELSFIDLRMVATREFSNTGNFLKYLPTGTKSIVIRGQYRITAGYKLENGASLQMEDGVPVADFPKPQILGIELLDHEILDEKQGWANKIKPQDRTELLKELREQMRRDAEQSGVLENVETSLRTRLTDLLGTDKVRIRQLSPRKSEGRGEGHQ